MAVACARPYASLHLAPDRQPRQYPTTHFLQAYKHIKIKPRICVQFILCLTWAVNANSLKQNIIVIKEICSSASWLDE